MDYTTVAGEGAAETVINKSRFIGYCAPAADEETARAFLEGIRKKHRDATHNCYAYRLRGGNTARYSDDGEPGGTAGLPMMDVLVKRGVVDCALVVTRYFGGVLLGAGGLVRAYTKAAVIALGAAGLVRMREAEVYELDAPYSSYDKLANFLKSRNISAGPPVFTERVRITAAVPLAETEPFLEELREQFEGRLQPVAAGRRYMAFSPADGEEDL